MYLQPRIVRERCSKFVERSMASQNCQYVIDLKGLANDCGSCGQRAARRRPPPYPLVHSLSWHCHRAEHWCARWRLPSGRSCDRGCRFVTSSDCASGSATGCASYASGCANDCGTCCASQTWIGCACCVHGCYCSVCPLLVRSFVRSDRLRSASRLRSSCQTTTQTQRRPHLGGSCVRRRMSPRRPASCSPSAPAS